MIAHRTVYAILVALLVVALTGFFLQSSQAAQSFDASRFDAAQAEGKAILIDVTAPWCPTCRAQKPTLDAVQSERPDLVVFSVDFDSRKDVLQRFGVRAQSTLIVFRGANEVNRSTGVSDPAQIRAQIAAAY